MEALNEIVSTLYELKTNSTPTHARGYMSLPTGLLHWETQENGSSLALLFLPTQQTLKVT